MKNWKTTLFGLLGGLALVFGPSLRSEPGAAPLNTGNLIAGALVAALGVVSKDNDVTGGKRPQ